MKKTEKRKKKEKVAGPKRGSFNKKFSKLFLNKACKFFSSIVGGVDMSEPLCIQAVLKDLDHEYYYIIPHNQTSVSVLQKNLILRVEPVEVETTESRSEKAYKEFDEIEIPTDEGRFN